MYAKESKRKKSPAPPIAPNPYLTPENRRYCKPCKYKGSFPEGYLCNFNVKTGKVRGCKPGVGCTRREFEQEDKLGWIERTCERCGNIFKGTKRAHFCPECRHIAIQKYKEEYFPKNLYNEKVGKKQGQI